MLIISRSLFQQINNFQCAAVVPPKLLNLVCGPSVRSRIELECTILKFSERLKCNRSLTLFEAKSFRLFGKWCIA